MLLVTGAMLSGFLGYKMYGWWAPAAVALAILAAQAVSYQGVLASGNGLFEFVQILVLGGFVSVFMFYATFSMGRSVGRWWSGTR